VIGGMADVPHGMACAALLAPVIEANVRALSGGGRRAGAGARSAGGSPAHPALGRYTEAARLLTGTPTASIEDGIAWIRETVTLLAVPGLASFGIRPQDAGEVAAKAATSSSMQGNPIPLETGELCAIVLQAL
jgi:alcohol dehydrogenase class IV